MAFDAIRTGCMWTKILWFQLGISCAEPRRRVAQGFVPYLIRQLGVLMETGQAGGTACMQEAAEHVPHGAQSPHERVPIALCQRVSPAVIKQCRHDLWQNHHSALHRWQLIH